MSDRIRWEDAPSFDPADYLGCAGTADAVMFRIFNHEPLRNEWVLTTDLPGMQQARHFAEGSSAPAELKGVAEEWLNRFIASLGAVFPDEHIDPDCPECGFGLPEHDRRCSQYAEASQ